MVGVEGSGQGHKQYQSSKPLTQNSPRQSPSRECKLSMPHTCMVDLKIEKVSNLQIVCEHVQDNGTISQTYNCLISNSVCVCLGAIIPHYYRPPMSLGSRPVIIVTAVANKRAATPRNNDQHKSVLICVHILSGAKSTQKSAPCEVESRLTPVQFQSRPQ